MDEPETAAVLRRYLRDGRLVAMPRRGRRRQILGGPVNVDP